MNGSAPNVSLTGSQTRPVTNERPYVSQASPERCRTFHTIAPTRTTEPTAAAAVTPYSETSPRRPLIRRRACSRLVVRTAFTRRRAYCAVNTIETSFTTLSPPRHQGSSLAREERGHARRD